MKKALLILASFLLTLSASAQLVLINSPASIAGSLQFTNAYTTDANWGVDLTTNIWTADGVLVDDGTAMPTQGCSPLINGADVAGKFALIDRGTCSFTQKVCNAQDAGAIGVIIMNHTAGAGPGPLGYTAGICTVTIPVVHISYEDGLLIKGELANGPVNFTIGNVVLGNNVGVNPREGLFHAPIGVIPVSQVQNPGDLIVTPGAKVTNFGFNQSHDVSVNAVITRTPPAGSPMVVYNETGSSPTIVEPDSAVLIVLDSYDATDGPGSYEIAYTISTDSTDEVPSDNTFTSNFEIYDEIFDKGGWDYVNDRPKITQSYTIAGGGNIEFLSPFYVPYGNGLQVDSIKFFVTTAAATLEGMDISAYLYHWDDINLDSVINNDEITRVGAATLEVTDSVTSVWASLPITNTDNFEEGYPLSDNEVIIAGVRYLGAESVFFGFDEDMDYTLNLDLLTANGTVTDVDLPYIGINAWTGTDLPDVDAGFLFTDNRSAVATALKLGPSVPTKDILADANISVELFPNPATDVLTATVDLKAPSSYLRYRVLDAAGHVLYTANKENVQQDLLKFNVAALANGQYFLVIQTDAGTMTKPFSVSH